MLWKFILKFKKFLTGLLTLYVPRESVYKFAEKGLIYFNYLFLQIYHAMNKNIYLLIKSKNSQKVENCTSLIVAQYKKFYNF